MENNEYLNSTKRIFQGLQLMGVFPFLFFYKGTRTRDAMSRLLIVFCIFFYFVTVSNKIRLFNRVASPILMDFNFNYLVYLIGTTYNRIFYVLIPLVTWKNSKDVHILHDQWLNYQKELEYITGTSYTSPFKKTIQKTAFIVTLFTLGLTMILSIKTDLTYYVLSFNTHLPAAAHPMILFELIFILWWANCKYVECEAKHLIILVQKSLLDHSKKNLEKLIRLWNMLCDVNDKFNTSNSALFVYCSSLCVVNVVTFTYYSLYLCFVRKSTIGGLTYFMPSLFCMFNIIFFYEAANSISQQITSRMLKILLNIDTIDITGEKLRSISHFLEVIEVRDPRIDLSGFITLDRTMLIPVYAMVVNYLIVLKQFATS